jgi:hypothetical protein
MGVSEQAWDGVAALLGERDSRLCKPGHRKKGSRLQRTVVTLLAPLRDQRRVQVLAAQQRPLPWRPQASYSAKISSLYLAEYVRRVARSGTSGSGGSAGMLPVWPPVGAVVEKGS